MNELEWSGTLLDGKRATLAKAEKAVADLGDGWRMPTVDELQTILDRSRYNPAIDKEKFPDTQSQPYWTGSPCAWNKNARWVVYFGFGYVGDGYGSYRACVRACRVKETKA